MDYLVCQEKLEQQELQVRPVKWVVLEMMDLEENVVQLDLLDPMVLQVHVENQDQRVCLEKTANLEVWDVQESEVLQDPQETQVTLVNLDFRGYEAPPVPLDQLEREVKWGSKV